MLLPAVVVGVLLALLAYAIAGRRLDVASRRAEVEPGQSFLVGLLGAFGTPLAVIIGSLLLAIGLIFLSALIDRLQTRKNDPYRKVKK